MKYVYFVVNSTDISGVWTDPCEAVKNEFSYDLKAGNGIHLHTGWGDDEEPALTVEEAVEEMLDPDNGYPYLAKIKVNPTDDSEVWHMDI